MSDMEKRLTDLELRYMKLERHVEELSAVVAEQQKLIDRLVAHVRSTSPNPTEDEKPPHY